LAITFVNFKQMVITSDDFQKAPTRRVSFALNNISYFIYNESETNSAVVQMLISPDRKSWMDDGLEVEVQPKQLINLVPNYFSKYSSVQYKSKINNFPVKLDIWFQMLRPPAKQCYGVGNDWS